MQFNKIIFVAIVFGSTLYAMDNNEKKPDQLKIQRSLKIILDQGVEEKVKEALPGTPLLDVTKEQLVDVLKKTDSIPQDMDHTDVLFVHKIDGKEHKAFDPEQKDWNV